MKFTTPLDIESWLHNLDLLSANGRCPAPKFIKPYHLATLGQKMRLTSMSEFQVPEKFVPYANTMKLWESLGLAPPSSISTRRASGRYYPIELLRDVTKIEDMAAALVELLTSICSDIRTQDSIGTMLRELIDNCYSHAEVPDGVFGLVCAQVWTGGDKAQISIVDTGIGIRSSLSLNSDLASRLATENACEMASEYGITSKPGRGHSGYGLAVARALMEQNCGNLIIRSGKEGFSCTNGIHSHFRTKLDLNGTLLVIEWNLSVPMNIGDVYRSFPLPEGMTNDDFDF